MIGSTKSCVAALMCGLSVMTGAACNVKSDKLQMNPREAWIDARLVLREAAQDRDQYTRAQAIEALARTLGEAAGATYIEGLSDSADNVRCAAALAVGDLAYAPAKGRLLQMAKFNVAGAERYWEVYAGVIYALHRLGDSRHVSDLADMLDSPSEEIRANAAMIIGRMGEPSAVKILKSLEAREREPHVRVQVLEALARLGDERSARMLEASVDGQTFGERLVAARALGRMETLRSIMVLKIILANPNQIIRARVQAAGSLARRGEVSDFGYRLCIESARRPREIMEAALKYASGGTEPVTALQFDVDSLQQLAVISLGWMKRKQAVDMLHPLLKSPNGGIRVAAAMSILRLLPEQARPARQPATQTAKKTDGEELAPLAPSLPKPRLKTSPWK